MTNKAIPDLTAAAALTGAEQVEVVQGGNSRRSTTGAIAAAPGAPMDVGAFVLGSPTASEILLRYVFTRAVAFPDDFAGSQAVASVAAAASTTFTVRKGGSSVGTIVFALGASTATFTTSGAGVSFAAGDVLELLAPATPDVALSNISITLAGVR